jgi:hypothetical protein
MAATPSRQENVMNKVQVKQAYASPGISLSYLHVPVYMADIDQS